MIISLRKTEHAALLQFGAAVASIPVEISDSEAFGPATTRVLDALANFVQQDVANSQRLLPEPRREAMIEAVKSTVAPAYRALVAAGLAEKRSIAEAKDRLMQPVKMDSALASEIRARFNSLPVPKQPGFIASADREQTSAIIAAGYHNTTIDAKFVEMLEERHMMLTHVAIAGLLAVHQRQATASSPLDSGPDEKAALEAARAALVTFKNRTVTLKHLEATLKGIVNVIAATVHVQGSVAFALLNGGK